MDIARQRKYFPKLISFCYLKPTLGESPSTSLPQTSLRQLVNCSGFGVSFSFESISQVLCLFGNTCQNVVK